MVNEDVFTVLAEQTRREILSALRDGDKAVGELVEELSASQPTVSKHLRVLREAGLVTMRAEGQRRYYKLETAPLSSVTSWLETFSSETENQSRSAAAPLESRRKPEATVVSDEESLSTPLADAPLTDPESMPQQIGRSVGRAATKAADLLANLPKFGRRKES